MTSGPLHWESSKWPRVWPHTSLVTCHTLMAQIHGKERQFSPYRKCQDGLPIGQARSCVLSGQVPGKCGWWDCRRDRREGRFSKAGGGGTSPPGSGGRGLGGPSTIAFYIERVRAAQRVAAGAGGRSWGTESGLRPRVQIREGRESRRGRVPSLAPQRATLRGSAPP